MNTKKGALFLVGGAADTVYADFVRLAGGPSAHIAILTHASEVPQKRADEISAGLKASGVTRITVLMPDDTQLPDDVDGIFISGGNQLTVVKLLEKSGLGQQIRDANRRGVIIGGTSAGAAAAGFLMLIGNTEEWYEDRDAIRLGRVILWKGLGLRSGIVFDTHFGQRKRQTRLRMVLGMFDDIIGIGLDEDTAVYINGDNCEVFGVDKVCVYTRGAGNDFQSIAKESIETTYSKGDKFLL